MPGGQELARDQFAALGVVLATLGMPDQAVARADIDQHRGRDLAGVRALLVRADVLRTEGDVMVLEVLDEVAQVRQRRQDHHLDAGDGQACGDAVHQLGGEGTAAVQLPVSGYDPATHRRAPSNAARRIADALFQPLR